MSMGIPMNNILIYNLTYLLSDGYKEHIQLMLVMYLYSCV